MKNLHIALLTLTLVAGLGISCVFAATYTKYSSKFIQKFRDCDYYEETINSTFEDKNFTTNRKILGWRNGACHYEETISSPTDKYKLACTFPALQVEELYQAMKTKTNTKNPEKQEIELFSETTNQKGEKKYVVTGTTTLIGNKSYIVWTKYQNNPYFCRPQKL